VTRSDEELEQYIDGLLDESAQREMQERLRDDPDLRGELDRVERFERMLDLQGQERVVQQILSRVEGERRSAGTLLRVLVAITTAAAAVAIWIAVRPQPPSHEDTTLHAMQTEWIGFGRRLGRIALERREGRVPRVGVGDLSVPPDIAAGVVFGAALDEMGVGAGGRDLDLAKDLVRAHFISMPRGVGVDAEYRRAQAALDLYRELRQMAGQPVADAYYDVFRPGLAALRTARRVPPGTLAVVVATKVSAEAGLRYERDYRDAVALLDRRYGASNVALVLSRLAPDDRRYVFRDAAQDGVSRDAVLAIRARFYKAALTAGVDKLYVDLG